MVAFIDDHLAEIGDAIVHDIFADQALNDCHVDHPGRLLSTAANAADRLHRKVEELGQAFDPLVHFRRPGAKPSLAM
jgi:hypothetical protein